MSIIRILNLDRLFERLFVVVMIGLVGNLALAAEPTLVVPANGVTMSIAVPVPESVRLDKAERWRLVEIDCPDSNITVQIVPSISDQGLPCEKRHRLIALIPPRDGAKDSRRFQLKRAEGMKDADRFSLRETNKTSLGVFDTDRPVLVYNHGTIVGRHVPETDARRSRACYVHPLYGLDGEVLTDDFPRDHYHHHGIFWTWPHVKIGENEYDVWADRGGLKQRFDRWLGRDVGPNAAVVGFENGWYVDERKVMIERIWLRPYIEADDSRALDLEMTWIPVKEPITLWGNGDRGYGGPTLRFIARDQKDVVITVPTGPTKGDLQGVNLAWADLTTRFTDSPNRSGASLFVSPDHPDYPARFLTRHYGPLCICWPGNKSMAKTFTPSTPIRLNYRIWIHRGAPKTPAIQEAYDAYIASQQVTWKTTGE